MKRTCDMTANDAKPRLPAYAPRSTFSSAQLSLRRHFCRIPMHASRSNPSLQRSVFHGDRTALRSNAIHVVTSPSSSEMVLIVDSIYPVQHTQSRPQRFGAAFALSNRPFPCDKLTPLAGILACYPGGRRGQRTKSTALSEGVKMLYASNRVDA